MERLITIEQAKSLKAALEALSANLKKRNALIAANNLAAAKNHAHAVRVMQARSKEIDDQADAAVQRVQNLLNQQGLGRFGGLGAGFELPLTWTVLGVSAAAAVGLAAIAAMLYTNYQVQREERLFTAENPVSSLVRQAQTGVWAVLGIGVVALGGLMYWDYRQKQPQRPVYRGERYPFERARPRVDRDLTALDTEMPARMRRVERGLPPTERPRGLPVRSSGLDKTDVDPEAERKAWESYAAGNVRERPVNVAPKAKRSDAYRR